MINTRWIAGVLLATCSMMVAAADASNSDEETVKADPASGFWSCNGIRLHMGVNMVSWTNLGTGDMFTRTEDPSPVDPADKDEKVKGTDYLYAWTKNPAVMKLFVVDKTGKNLYMRDDLKYYKVYRCKRDK